MNALIYDLEIVKAVPMRNEPVVQGIEYCAGWHDHRGMGISVIGCYDCLTDRYRVFLKDNFEDFLRLTASRALLISFNGIGFDNKVIASCLDYAIPSKHCYDILAELWAAAGLEREFNYRTHGGFKLDTVARVNFGDAKTGNGGLAPIEWQQGRLGNVIDYCLQDVRITRRCLERIIQTGGLRDPRDESRFLAMEKPAA